MLYSVVVAIGQKIYLLRIKKGITQAELSVRSGIPQANLSNIEKEKQDLTVSTLLQICSALGTDPAELFNESETAGRVVFTRSRVEKVARGILDSSVKLSGSERKIADLVKSLIPMRGRRALPGKKIYSAWYELRKRLTDEEIKILVERVNEKKFH